MSAPLCPVHQKPMNAGDPAKGGGWYCSKKDPTKPNGWCDQRIKAPATAQAASTPVPAQNNRTAIVAAALVCAGQIYHAGGQVVEAEALDFVDRIVRQYGGTQ